MFAKALVAYTVMYSAVDAVLFAVTLLGGVKIIGVDAANVAIIQGSASVAFAMLVVIIIFIKDKREEQGK
jgi:hypothetical protein